MKERPIIFNSEMVKAIIDGRKTITRRIMKVQPESNQFGIRRIIASTKRSDSGKYHWTESNATGIHIRSAPFSCPFGVVGDRLWVREKTKVIHILNDKKAFVAYLADGEEATVPVPDRLKPIKPGYCLSNGCYREASRITLEITGVRVERLWDITEDDAKAEGCTFEALRFKPGTREVEEMGHTAVYQFGVLWQSIYGADSWQANPFVWVIAFKRVEE